MRNKIINTMIAISIFLLILGIGMQRYEHEKQLNDTNQIVNQLTNQLTERNDNYNSCLDELDKTQEELSITIENSKKIEEELFIANKTIDELKNEEYELIYLGDFKITHYCVQKFEHICGTGSGFTATGTQVTAGRTIAVDPSVIPYGTEVYIEGYGWRIAEDCGGAVNSKHIDVAVNTHDEAMSMGVKSGGVWMLVKKTT